jgi:EAL domain-containing protein (putative c-di-GMP-specific phosphodiesterase class I)
VTLSVNVSPRTLESAEFSAAAFISILRRHGFAPARIVLELTERESIRDIQRLGAVLMGVQDAGVRVAADDVGAGNAGLRLLSQFRFDVVKIDLSLVQRAGDDQTHSVLRSIVEVAQRMGATTIAEGVETSGQLRTARRLGITAGQGYLLGRPGSERDVAWVDIATLEQREDVPFVIEPAPLDPRIPAGPRWPSTPDADSEVAVAALGGGAMGTVRRSMPFFKATRRGPE